MGTAPVRSQMRKRGEGGEGGDPTHCVTMSTVARVAYQKCIIM